jgi:RecA/RadA recombinase
MNVKLAEALLRRKELQQKVDQVRTIKEKDLYEIKAQRRQVTENIDDILAQVPKLSLSQVTSEYDFYSKQLRLVDAAIQNANWNTDIVVADSVMADFAKE